MRNLLAGSFSGTISYMCIYSIDYSRVMLSVNAIPQNLKLHQAYLYLLKNHGFLKMYRGLSATIIGSFPYCGLKFYFF